MRYLKRILFSLLPGLLLFALLEGVLAARHFKYEPRQRLLWKPTVAEFVGTMENYYPTEFDPPGYIWLRKDNIVGQDLQGNRIYRWPTAKPAGVKRIAFLGGSTSEAGGDHPYPERCIALLNAVAGRPEYDMLNVACSSYSSHQCLMSLSRYALPRQPDLVVMYEGWNDSGVMGDGYADKEKDSLMRQNQLDEQALQRFKGLRNLRLTQLLGRGIDAMDRKWPRVRVAPDDFRKNLQAIARLCAERNIPVVMVVKPRSHILPLNVLGDTEKAYFHREYGTLDAGEIYLKNQERYGSIQKEVGAGSPNARLADAESYLMAAEDQLLPYPPGIDLFVSTVDRGHCTGLGYQKLAEVVALSIAPERAEAIHQYLDSGDYWRRLALEFKQMSSPYECAFAAKEAVRRDAGLAESLDPVIQEAEQQFEFVDSFEKGRWDGRLPADQWPAKLQLLQHCLTERPGDYGVLLQIFRVGIYTGHLNEALEGMKTFKPATAQDQYNWLQLLFQGFVEIRQWANAETVAHHILTVSPNDRTAQSFLQYIEQQRTAQGL